jgi:YHS domain-containing protein
MKSRFTLAALLLAALVAVHSLRAADDKKEDKLKDAKCPVSGKAINPEAIVEYNGGKVYFCCMNCPKAFKADTEKFAGKANHQLVQTGQLKQVACPLTGKDVNPDATVDVAGVKVAFCCMNCKGKVAKASGDEQIDLVFKDTKKGFKPADEAKK